MHLGDNLIGLKPEWVYKVSIHTDSLLASYLMSYTRIDTSQCLTENRIVCGNTLRILLKGKHDVGQCATNVAKKSLMQGQN